MEQIRDLHIIQDSSTGEWHLETEEMIELIEILSPEKNDDNKEDAK